MILTAQKSVLTQKHRQNANYLQLGGITNWLHAVMTNVAQRLNICRSQSKKSTAPIAPPSYAPGNIDWWPFDFVLILL